MSILTKDKCNSIKSFSKNNLPLLQQMIDETEFSDFQELVGTKIYDKLVEDTSAETIPEELQSILDDGLYAVIAYLTYCNYIQQSGLFDTFSGMVTKNMSDSNAATNGQIKNMVIHNRQIAEMHYRRVKDRLQEYYNECTEDTIKDDFSEIIGTRKREKCKTIYINNMF